MSARDYALHQLDRQDLPAWPPNLARWPQRREPPTEPLDPRDANLARRIYVGVIKNLLLLQHLISHYAQRPPRKIDPLVQKVLTVALYQLRYLTRVPASAAVNEAVEQTRRLGLARSAPFVNAILRRALRDPNVPLPGPDRPREFAQLTLSHPPALVDRLISQFGNEQMLAFCRHSNSEPPLILRLGPTTTIANLPKPENVRLLPHHHPNMAIAYGATRSTLAAWAAANLAQPQDPTSAAVAALCQIAPGMRVLDRCCGSGTKTIQLAAQVGPTGHVLAVDPAPARYDALRQTLAQLHIIHVQVAQAAMLNEIPGSSETNFDRILLDVPCSNSGVLARRPEARYTQDPRRLASLTKLQDAILDDTTPRLAKSGLLIFSTCSIWPEENRARIERLLKSQQQFELLSEQTTLPSPFPPTGDPTTDDPQYHDAGYIAVLRKN
jgi:16S rRNA (cytosine967-C5)-methyltransferase